MHAMNMATHKCKHYLSIYFFDINYILLMHLKNSFCKKVQFRHDIFSSKDSKGHLYIVQTFFEYFISLTGHHLVY